MAKCIEDSRSCWRASSESTSVGIEVWNYVRRQPLMQTNHVDSTSGIRNYPILGRGEGRGVLVAVVVWRADLYPKEVLRLSNTCFIGKVDKDLTPINQNIVKNTINDLMVKSKNFRPLILYHWWEFKALTRQCKEKMSHDYSWQRTKG